MRDTSGLLARLCIVSGHVLASVTRLLEFFVGYCDFCDLWWHFWLASTVAVIHQRNSLALGMTQLGLLAIPEVWLGTAQPSVQRYPTALTLVRRFQPGPQQGQFLAKH